MVRPNVVTLRQFYSSALGQLSKTGLTRAIRARWPELNGDLLVGIGYANPFLRSYLREEEDGAMWLIPIMPAAQGAICWPHHQYNRALLSDELRLPVANNVANRLLLVHALENTGHVAQMVEECWRVLCPGGRMLVVVPNRRGLWASSPHTPFSYGHPYSVTQLREALCPPERFTHIDTSYALHFMPHPHGLWRRLAMPLQAVGHYLFGGFGGVIVMEVEKQIYAGIKEPRKKLAPQPVFVPVGSKPAMSREARTG